MVFSSQIFQDFMPIAKSVMAGKLQNAELSLLQPVELQSL
ncbi:hypothetical protein CEV31_2759 [Brucella thiophenivorans]|uniref:Uncharacterized protein n=1 Tax=Brucella thiophenivorans TaxID=571255 RepID=A0A256FLJ9_9HYPH|nr:hypothetical protein CEV31_2759 [Brucella thiophenivorans]